MNVGFEYILVYAKSTEFLMQALQMQKKDAPTKGRWDVFWSNADRPTMRYDILGFTPQTGQWRTSKEKADIAISNYQKFLNNFEQKMTIEEYSIKSGITKFIRRIPAGTGKNGGVQHWIAPSSTSLRTSNWTDIEVSQISKEIDLPFDNPKSKQLIMELIKLANLKNDDILLDFFAGSCTTAHAVMQLNAEDGGNRQFIMVQLPEPCNEQSEAFKAGYTTIAEISKERIRRAGKKISADYAEKRRLKEKEESENLFSKAGPKNNLRKSAQSADKELDIGFRVLKIDSSNMAEVYYTPDAIEQDQLNIFTDNIKSDRKPEDLLFQVLLDWGVDLSLPIRKERIHPRITQMNADSKPEKNNLQKSAQSADKKSFEVFFVDENSLVACFDTGVNEDLVKELARFEPLRAVFRDTGFVSDAVKINAEQIFKQMSPHTEVRSI
jgi:adenine-specific DNA-methyltransferase